MRIGKRTIWAENPCRFPFVTYEVREYACVCISGDHKGSKVLPEGELFRYDICGNCEKYHRYMFHICDDCDQPYISNFRHPSRIVISCRNQRCYDCWDAIGSDCDCENCVCYSDPMYARNVVHVVPRVVIRPPRSFLEVINDDFNTDF